jgi:hypothetical protein
VTSGVPQRSHLGPLCFIWFVNRSEIFDYVRVFLFADDMRLFLPVSGFQDCLKIMSDLNKLSEWCDRNSLLLNVGKCKTITFARSRHPVEWDRARSGELLKRSRSHHERENDFFGACGRHGCKGLCDDRINQKTFVGVSKSVYYVVSLHVSGSSKAVWVTHSMMFVLTE